MRNQAGLWVCTQDFDEIVPSNNTANAVFRGSNTGPLPEAPTLAISFPQEGAIIEGSAQVVRARIITGAVSSVTFYLYGPIGFSTTTTAIGTATGPYSITFDAVIQGGAFQIYAIATAPSGATRTSASINVTTPPA